MSPPLFVLFTGADQRTGAMRQTSTGGWLRALDGGKTKPGLASVPGGVKLARETPVKPAPKRPMKQLDLFDLE